MFWKFKLLNVAHRIFMFSFRNARNASDKYSALEFTLFSPFSVPTFHLSLEDYKRHRENEMILNSLPLREVFFQEDLSSVILLLFVCS